MSVFKVFVESVAMHRDKDLLWFDLFLRGLIVVHFHFKTIRGILLPFARIARK